MSTPCRRAEHNTLLSRSKVHCDSRMCLHCLAKLNTLNLFIKNQAVSSISPTNPFHSEEWRFGFKLPDNLPVTFAQPLRPRWPGQAGTSADRTLAACPAHRARLAVWQHITQQHQHLLPGCEKLVPQVSACLSRLRCCRHQRRRRRRREKTAEWDITQTWEGVGQATKVK